MAFLALQNVSKVYDVGKPNEYRALQGVTLEINRGEFVAVMGVSGSGKSTLMHILGCLDKPTSGSFVLDGENVSEKKAKDLVMIRRKKIGFIFQTFNLLPRLSSLANIELPLIYNRVPSTERKQRSLAMLDRVGLKERSQHKPSELSGGEQQRVAIARALVNNPSVILADEPTGNLDTKSGGEIMTILEKLNRTGTTIIVVTHDPAIASRAKRTIRIQDGAILT